jgi:hypothetical protein
LRLRWKSDRRKFEAEKFQKHGNLLPLAVLGITGGIVGYQFSQNAQSAPVKLVPV